MPELTITLPDQTIRSVPLERKMIVVGRDQTCDLPIPDMDVSRQHLRISPRADAGYLIEDLASTNHTYVNGQAVHVHNLQNGDEICIGRTRIVYHQSDISSMTPSVTMSDAPSVPHNLAFTSRTDRFRLSQQRLNLLYKLVDRLTSLRARDELLDDAMNVCFDMLQFERGVIALKDKYGGDVQWALVRNKRGNGNDITISRTLVDRSLVHGERVIVNDPQMDVVPTHSMVASGLVSAMCVPIGYGDKTVGVIYGDRVTTQLVYEPEDVDFLAAIAQHLSIGLANVDLAEQQRLRDQLQREFDLARDIQRGLFPKKLPDLPGVKIAAISDPGLLVSGDYYDVISLDDGRIGLIIADVSGKGMSAALLMANLQAAVRVTLSHGYDLAALLQEWNRLIVGNTDGSRFITLLAGILDPVRRRFTYASAGHFSPYLISATGTVEETPHEPGIPLGILDTAEYKTLELDLPPGTKTLFFYTDGLPEAFNLQRVQFADERTMNILAKCSQCPPDTLVTEVRSAIADFAGDAPQSDDITLLAVQIQ